MGIRRKGREYALQVLYLCDVANINPDKSIKFLMAYGDIEKPIADFAERLAQGTMQHIKAIDPLIIKHAKNWEITRMAALDRNVLRLGAYELMFEDTPISVVIDEAVELAKMFSTDESGKFVNGILDKIKSERPKNSDDKKESK